jgi:hypothetical protein
MSTRASSPTVLRELVEIGPSTALPSEPRRLLDEFLAPARDPGAPASSRIDAYRLLLLALEGNLWDHDFAARLHREWMASGVHGRSRRRPPGPASGRRSASRSARR